MAPDEIEWFKLDRRDDAGDRAEQRTQLECELAQTAFRSVAVGPRLFSRFQTELHALNCAPPLRMDPGFDQSEVPPIHPPPGAPWRILIFGRAEDHILKGLDIGAGAAGLAASRRSAKLPPLELTIRGAPDGTAEKLRREAIAWAKPGKMQIVVKSYADDAASIAADLRRSSLVLMPSRSEGFGLVGLEAIVAGVPCLISENSGLGQLLGEVLRADELTDFVVAVDDALDQDRERWARAIETLVADRESSFKRMQKIGGQLAKTKIWSEAAAALLAEVD